MPSDDGFPDDDDGVPEPLLELTITVHRNALFEATTRIGPTIVLESQAASLEELLDAVGRSLRRAVM